MLNYCRRDVVNNNNIVITLFLKQIVNNYNCVFEIIGSIMGYLFFVRYIIRVDAYKDWE